MRIRTGLVALVALAAAIPAAQAGEGFGGLYSGFTLGSHSQKADWYTTDVRYRDETRLDPSDPDNEDEYDAGTSLPALSGTMASFKDDTYGVGLVLGYNWQFSNNLVLGVEVAAGAAATYDRTAGTAPGLGASEDENPVTYAAVKTSKPLVAGLTAGYVVAQNTLAYVRVNYERIVAKGIISSTACPSSNLNYDPDADPPGNAPIPCDINANVSEFGSSEKLYGWGLGLGVEHKFSDMFGLRLEYRRAEYGRTKSMTIMEESTDNFGADALIDVKKANIVELGVIFHF